MPPRHNKNLEDAIYTLRIHLENKLDKIDGKLTDVNNDLLHVKDHHIKKLLEENTLLRKKVTLLSLLRRP